MESAPVGAIAGVHCATDPQKQPGNAGVLSREAPVRALVCGQSGLFITSRCREKFPAFESDEAKQIFWDRFEHYSKQYNFVPWVTTLLNNHYHTLGYLKRGDDLGQMMRHIHGSVAKLVNDRLENRLVPFWCDAEHEDYFDGCIRNEKQCRRAYRYTLTQSVRHRICADWRDYPHTRVRIEVDRGVRRAHELSAFMEGVPYKRYEKGSGT
jgi:hypothetical protein